MKPEVPELQSIYYPPRARWYAPLRDYGRWGLARLGLDSDGHDLRRVLPRLLLDILIPGLSFEHYGYRRVAIPCAAGWLLGLTLFVVLLGTTVGNAGFALATSLHAISAGHGFVKHLERRVLALRMALGLALAAGLAGSIYLPASAWFCTEVAMPLQTPRGVVIVNPHAPREAVQRGQVVAYRYGAAQLARGLVMRDGFATGRVLAVGGDQVEFGPTEFAVNQARFSRREFMPAEGRLTLPPGTWFIWPELHIGRYAPGEETLSAAFLGLSVVPATQFAGRAFDWWFFRTQQP